MPDQLMSKSDEAIWQQKVRDFLERQPADPEQIASASLHLWDRLAVPLYRMVGPLGVVSLFARCVDLTNVKYPWFPRSHHSLPDQSLFPTVWASIGTQPHDAALEASISLFVTFFELLAVLIGDRLTAKVFSGIS